MRTMGNIPSKRIDQIVWFENHWPLWEPTPTLFGVTAAKVADVKVATGSARAAYDAAQAAKQAAQMATLDGNEQAGAMLGIGRDVVNIIKAFIEDADDPSLWAQAGIVPSAPPGTAPAPTAPYGLSATLDSEGNLILKWKASQPRGVTGVIYSIRRNFEDGPFTLIDSVGEKTYTDMTVPFGTKVLSYTIQAKRGPQTSALSPALTIRFGRVGVGGSMSIASMETTPAPAAKLAA
jgi:hypothetical protein